MAYKLLLADDSITIQKVVELTLSEEGFDVTAVGDGASALETAEKLVPDIVLADVFMPKMDGYELCSKIKTHDRFKGVPVMLLAGTFEEFDESRALAVGADDKLTKPFESAELISKVKGLVENRPAPAAPQAEEPVAVPAAVEPEAAIEAAVEAEAAEEANDLWSVVDMSSEEQPLAGATEVLSEEDLWKRANLTPETEEAGPAEEEGLPLEELPVEAFEEAEEATAEVFAEEPEGLAAAEPYAEDTATFEEDSDKTAVLNMDDLQSSVYGEQAEDVPAIEVAEVTSEQEITSFESLGEATDASDYSPPSRPAATAAPVAVSEETIRAEVMKAAQSIIDAKVKEALSAMAGEMIERIVWEVVPELAEELIQKEIDKIKTGS